MVSKKNVENKQHPNSNVHAAKIKPPLSALKVNGKDPLHLPSRPANLL